MGPPLPLFLDLLILKVLRESRRQVRILKDLFAPKQGKIRRPMELRILKDLAMARGEFVPANSVPQIRILGNSKLKANKEKELAGTFGKS